MSARRSSVGRLEQTTLFVTHDIEEAAYLGDRVIAMSRVPGPHHRRAEGSVRTAADT